MKRLKLTPEQILLAIHLKELGIGPLVYEYYFHEERGWRFDVAVPDQRLAFECNGGQFKRGHRSGFWPRKERLRREAKGIFDTPVEDENLKLATAQLMGWRVLPFTNQQINDGRAKAFLAEHLGL